MTRISWGDAGSRLFEAGIDRVVLFVGDNPGVPWNGIRSIKETPSGGTPQPYYLDGVKYLNVSSLENFDASIQAYSAPDEFAECDGTSALYAGLSATQQPRKPFNFAYRTKFGNEIDGLDYGYKLHLIYNAIAAPSSRTNNSLGGTITPNDLTWAISTTPVFFTGIKPTSHFIIDSIKSGPDLMSALEDYIYGTSIVEPSFPDPDELMGIFSDYGHLRIKDLGLGHYSAEGLPVTKDGPATFTIDDPSVVDNGDQSFTITY